jgi:hypothetical protein
LAESVWNSVDLCLTYHFINSEYINFVSLNIVIRYKKRRSLNAVIFTHKIGRCF